ncbi:hypothetical protein [Gymnodinialimonas hymeniacidonis]|uniref:hypothetical protein n=1 Tax=Gymnodinialimonas hymeniacidonis TaxID=3126508 RepID=UPI0034C6BE07
MRLALLLGSALFAAQALLAAAPLSAQPRCQSSPPAISLYDPGPARETFPAVVRNAFTDGTAPEHLTLSVHLPGTLTPDCPNGSIEPMRGIRDLGDGRYEGTVVHNSLSHHSHLFGETYSFTTDQIWDWQLVTPQTEGRFYGAFQSRRFAETAPDGGGVMISLMPDPIPADWN